MPRSRAQPVKTTEARRAVLARRAMFVRPKKGVVCIGVTWNLNDLRVFV